MERQPAGSLSGQWFFGADLSPLFDHLKTGLILTELTPETDTFKYTASSLTVKPKTCS